MEMEEGMVDAPIPGDIGFQGSLQVPSNTKDSVILSHKAWIRLTVQAQIH